MSEINENRFNKLETDGKLDVSPPVSFIRQPKPLSALPVFTRRKILAYGVTKAGKTHFGGTFPGMKEGKAAIIEVDGSLNGLPRDIAIDEIAVWQFLHSEVNDPDPKKRLKLFNVLYELLKSFVPNPYGWRTLMIDGLTTLASFLLDEVMWDKDIGKSTSALSGERNPTIMKATFDEWGALLARLQALFTVIDALPMNIYVTATVQFNRTDSGAIIGNGMPACQGSFRKEVGKYFDGVIVLQSKGGKHYAYPKGTGNTPGGVRQYTGPTFIEAPTYTKIFKEENFGNNNV